MPGRATQPHGIAGASPELLARRLASGLAGGKPRGLEKLKSRCLDDTAYMLYPKTMVELIFFETEGGRAPVRDSLETLPEPDQAKAAAYLSLLERHGHTLREPHVKHLQDKLKELRFKISAGQYRVFFFIHMGDNAVLLHSIVKKTQQTPKPDMDLALKRMREWLRRYGG